jgi:hypothetical protein
MFFARFFQRQEIIVGQTTTWARSMIDSSPVGRTEVDFSTQLHGGFASCTMTLVGQKEKSFWRTRALLAADMALYDEYGRTVFDGIVQAVETDKFNVKVTVDGVFSRAKELLHGIIYTTGSTVEDVVNDCVDLVPEWNHFHGFIAHSTYIVGALDFSGDKKISDAFDEVLKYGFTESDFRPVYFAIWENRNAFLFPEPSLNTPKWRLSLSNILGGAEGITISRDAIFNRIFFSYDNPDQTQTTVGTQFDPVPEENKISQYRYLVKEGVLNAGPVGDAMGRVLAKTALGRYAYPRQVYTATVAGLVRHFSGRIEYPYMIRAGDVISVMDSDYLSVQTGLLGGLSSNSLSGLVLGTEYSGTDNTLAITFGVTETLEIRMSRLGLTGGLN